MSIQRFRTIASPSPRKSETQKFYMIYSITTVTKKLDENVDDEADGEVTPPYGVSRSNSNSTCSTIRADQTNRQISRPGNGNNNLLCCTAAKAVKRTYPVHY